MRLASSWRRRARPARIATSNFATDRPEVRMSWRLLATMIGFGLLSSPLFAADPLPAMQETPALLEQVKAGALPPVGQRIPQQPRIVRRFAGGGGPGRP